jgi:putative spermidine/putrescine transport system permease protein
MTPALGGPAARRASRAAWICAAPLLALTGATILGPFVWRAGSALAACLQTPGCEEVWGPYYRQAIVNTVLIAALSSAIALPVAVAACVAAVGRPAWVPSLRWLASLGANFAGVPLALAFTLMFGVQGVFTQLLGGNAPLRLDGFSGLLAAYVCFQLPLAALLMLAPVQLLDASLEEAAATLGASRGLYWRRVALPLLAPSLIEVGVLLFANAAAAYATPFALAGTNANMLAVRLTALVSGDLFADPRLPSLLALILFGLLVGVMALGRILARHLARGTGLAP